MAQITFLTGRERRRRWSDDDRRRILAAAFKPGAVVSEVARQCEVSTSLLYKWRHDAMKGDRAHAFVPAVLAAGPGQAAQAPAPPAPDTASIIVEFSNGARLKIGAQTPAALVAATLAALR
jgi:transposase